MTDLAKLVVRLETQNSQYMAGLEAANKKLDRFTKSADLSAKRIARGVAAAAVASATAFAAMTKAAIDHGDALDEMSQQTGVSVESLSRLEYAAKFSSVSLEDLAKSQGKLSKNMADAAKGSKTAAEGFKLLGVQFKNNDNTLRSSEDVLLDVAEKFSQMEDGAGKTALAIQVFGKAGASMIPFLNEGRDGIAALSKEADKLGVTMSSETAKKAAQLNDSMDRISGTVKGLVNQFLEKALPTLIAISEKFLDSAQASGGLAAAVGVLAFTFKSLVTAGVIVKSVFQTLGRVIYGVGEAVVRVAQGEFKLAVGAISDAFVESKDSMADSMDTIAKIWGDLPAVAETVAKDTDKALKKSVMFNDESAKEKTEKAAQAALDSLRTMKEGIDENIATFGMGESAAIKYRVTVGSLADTVKEAGDAGKMMAEGIISAAQALELLETNDAVADLDNQIRQLTDDTVQATGAMFDLQNKALRNSLNEQGNSAGLKALDRLREMTVAQVEFNKLEEEAVRSRADLAIVEEQISNTREIGATTELQSLKQLDEARAKTVAQLQLILDKQTAIASSSGNTAMIDSAKKAAEELARLNSQTDLFVKKLRTDITGVLEDGILVSLNEGFSKGAKGALKAFGSMLEQMLAQAAAAQLSSKLFGAAGTGGGGGLGGWVGKGMDLLSGIFGGSRDSGGRGHPGKVYEIGTGAQPEMFVPDTAGQFYPANQLPSRSGGGVTQIINVQGQINERTTRQLAMDAARAQARATRYN